jgi:hypothetical protein
MKIDLKQIHDDVEEMDDFVETSKKPQKMKPIVNKGKWQLSSKKWKRQWRKD